MFKAINKPFITICNDHLFSQQPVIQRFLGTTSCLLKNVINPSNELNVRSSDIPSGNMGQPTCHTHPHMVKPGELVPGLTQTEFSNRRCEFMKRLILSVSKEHRDKGHTVIVPSAAKQYMTDKIPRIFRQNSDFYYLTGCLEADSLLIMTSLPGNDSIHKTILLLRGKDEHSELWDGPRTSIDDATQLFRVDVALPYKELVPFLTRTDHLWYSPGSPVHGEIDSSVKKIINTVQPNSPHCPRRILASQRLIKSSAEVELMLETCKLGSSAVNNAMSCTKAGISEHDILALLDYYCRRNGAEHLAFPPVIAGGLRATAIHYIHDNQMLSDGELLLVDAGCQKFYYNSDITRTWPVSGKFTNAQAVLYDIVLNIQTALIHEAYEQRPSLDKLFDIMCKRLGAFLREEGIIPKSTSNSELNALAFNFCPHHVSHYLGLDIHDTPQILRNVPIMPGMVITVEPGIYISPHEKSVPEEFRGIGIRIEDDLLITHGDPIVLTEKCIKDRREIEAIVGTKSLP